MNVETTITVYAKLENRPGALEKATRALSAKSLNVDAISLETVGSSGLVRILTPRPKEAVTALKGAGIDAFESEAVVASIPDRPGELARAAAELATAGINIEGIVTTPERRLAIRTNDPVRTEQILRKL